MNGGKNVGKDKTELEKVVKQRRVWSEGENFGIRGTVRLDAQVV